MDFLDPKRKKAHRQRLLIGYVLMAIVIALATFILLLTAYGYDVDRKTGSIIQNGIVYVDSKPGGAQVYLDGKLHQDTTDTRLDLPAGQYTVKLARSGYRDWQRTFFLDGGQIQRLVYPLLIPNNLKPSDSQLYASAPSLASQSPDRHWILIQQPEQTYVFDVVNTAEKPATVESISLPATLLTEPEAPASLKFVDWSNDNKHVLLERTYGEGKLEFLILNREDTDQSVNINTLLGVSPTKVTLRDKKPDQIYFTEANGTLRSGNTKDQTISAPLINDVLAYKSYANNLILYATQEGIEEGRTEFRIREDNKTYKLKTVPEGSVYLVELSKYNDNWYYALGSNTDDAVYIYKNPLDILKGKSGNALTVSAVLRVENPQFVSFSANVEFVAVQSGRDFMTYDIENDRQFTVALKDEIDLKQELKWMDGHRLAWVKAGKSYMIDFDGSNRQELIGGIDSLGGPFFDRDYENMYSLAPSVSVKNRFALIEAPLRLEE